MKLEKTDKARNELRPGARDLGVRERSLLLLANGSRSIVEFSSMFGGAGERMVLELIREGYLRPTSDTWPQ